MADLFPSSIDSLEVFGSPNIFPGSISLSVPSIFSDEDFGISVLLYDQTLDFSAIDSSEILPSPFLIPGPISFTVSGIASEEDVVGAFFVGPVLFPTSISTSEEFGTALNINFTIFPIGIESGEDFSYVIEFPGISSSELFGNHSFAQVLKGAGAIPSAETFFPLSVGNITLHSSIVPAPTQMGKPSVFALEEYPCVTPQLKTIIPDFIIDDHPNFVVFMEAYYEYLERQGQPVYDIARFPKNIDIDSTVDSFIEEFRKTFLVNLPNDLVVDKATLIKYVVEYYRSRGTEKSYELFFRILLDQQAEFFFPRVDILKPSDGKWIQNRTLRVLQRAGNPFDLKGRKIIGLNNNATAFVEKVQRVQEGPFSIYELFLNASSITGTFSTQEDLTDIDGKGIEVETIPVVTGLDLSYAGTGYTAGQEFLIEGTQGVGAIAKIKTVNSDGSIKTIQMRNFGAGYYGTQSIDLSLSGTISDPAIGEPILGALAVYEGFFLNNDGFLNDTKYLQDGVYYQQYSYVTIVDASLDQYKDILLTQLHPAGYKLFGLVRSQNLAKSRGIPARLQPCGWVDIIRQPDLLTYFAGTRTTYTDVKRLVDIPEGVTSFKSGHNYRSLERNKFYYKPYEPYNEDAEVAGSANDGYWDQYGNMQIKDIEHLTIEEVSDYPYRRINITADPVIRHNPAEGDYGIPSAEHFGVHDVDTI